MSRVRALSLALSCACAVALASPGFAQEPGARLTAQLRARAASGGPVRVIVRLRTAVRAEGRLTAGERATQRAGIRRGIDLVLARLPDGEARRAQRFATIPFFAAEVSAASLQRLAADPDVVSIEEDVLEAPALAESVPLVGAPGAWSAGYSGAGWTVVILDTGVDRTHAFLTGKVVAEACYSNAGGAGGGIALCPGSASESTSPDSGLPCAGYTGCEHGTHVAGIAAGHSGSLSGVARDASLIAVQVFTGFGAGDPNCDGAACVLSFASDQIRGLERVLALKDTFKVAAVNMSLGGTERFADTASCDAANEARKAVIDNLRSVGIATVVSSGNSGFVDGLGAPACVSSAVSVGASTRTDQVASFSNAASFLSLLAPGSGIVSSVPGGGFAAMSGTSMAAPHVAGSWAIMKSRKPQARVDEILAALRSTGTAIRDSLSGLVYPRIQVDRAVAALPVVSMSLDTPAKGARVAQPFAVAGWAIDQSASSGSGIDAIHVYAFPAGGGAASFLGSAPYGFPRPDVAAVYDDARFTDSGFNLTVSGLPAGTYLIVAYAHSTLTGTFDASAAATVVVPPAATRPLAAIDTPAEGATVAPSFTIAGWTLDLEAVSGTGIDAIHVYAFPDAGGNPMFLGTATGGAPRPDVAAAFGPQFEPGGYMFTAALSEGGYTLVVYSRSVASGVFSPVSRHVTVRPPGATLMAIDTPQQGATPSGSFTIAGWAIDLDSTEGPGIDAIHVWAIPASGAPQFLGAAAYGVARGDVGAAFGPRFAASGYTLAAPALPQGTWQIEVYPHSAVTGIFGMARVVTVTVR